MRKTSGQTSSDVMKRFLETPGVQAAIVVGRDGFIIEAVGGERAMIELDALGAAVATMADAAEKMSRELGVKGMEDMFITYGGAVIVAYSLGDAILTLVTPDASTLGVIRHHSRKLLPELKEFL